MDDEQDDETYDHYAPGDALPTTDPMDSLTPLDLRLVRNLGRVAKTDGVPPEHLDAFYVAAMSTVLILADELRIQAEASGPSQASFMRGLAAQYESIPQRIAEVDTALAGLHVVEGDDAGS